MLVCIAFFAHTHAAVGSRVRNDVTNPSTMTSLTPIL